MTKYEELPDKIKNHLKGVLSSSGMPQTEASLEELAFKWTEKLQLFKDVTTAHLLQECDFFAQNDPRAAIALTYSGSLITIGTLIAGSRWVEYASIKLRKDVPAVIKSEKVNLTADIQIDACAAFSPGLLRRTSEILTIACCASELSPPEQEEQIQSVTLALTGKFIGINNE